MGRWHHTLPAASCQPTEALVPTKQLLCKVKTAAPKKNGRNTPSHLYTWHAPAPSSWRLHTLLILSRNMINHMC